MIICLEGPDGAGKTTLVDRLTEDYVRAGYTVHRLSRGPLHIDPMDAYVRPLEDAQRDFDDTINTATVTIMDRWHVGELIYGPLLRGASRLTIPQAAYVECVMNTFDTHFWHLTSTIETLERRYNERGDDLIKREYLPQIMDGYIGYVMNRPHWVTRCSTNFELPPRPQRNWEGDEFIGQYIGARQPQILLLGDRRNDDRMMFPFVPFPSTSGHWLFRALIDADVNTQNIGIVNANEITGLNLGRLWRILGKPRVVALGNEAESAWRRSGLPPVALSKVPHPQFMRQFHHRDTATYAMKIKEVMTNSG